MAGCLVLATLSAQAATGVEAFGAGTWAKLSQAGDRPSAIVFSTTDCMHCPKVINALAQAARRSPRHPRLTVVVMDGQGQEADMLADPHYRQADALYAFHGDDTALRYTVNPDWRGLTPYVVFVEAGSAPRYYTGKPPTAAWQRFFGR